MYWNIPITVWEILGRKIKLYRKLHRLKWWKLMEKENTCIDTCTSCSNALYFDHKIKHIWDIQQSDNTLAVEHLLLVWLLGNVKRVK